MARLKRQPLNDLAFAGVLVVVEECRIPVEGAVPMARAGAAEKLNTESIKGWLSVRRGWKRRANKLTKDFEFDSFRDSIVFVNRIATLADTLNHHPDIDVRYSTVTVTVTTHDAGGITEKDLDLAEQIDFATSAE
jgi:4a-hydroxytetrahydrobiopterin dehydratase